MMKKLLFISLLSTAFGAHAVLLRDGSSVPRAKVNKVYRALKSLRLSAEGTLLIADLSKSCNSTPRELTFSARNIGDVIDKISINTKQRLETAIALELCDNNGIIDEETAHIILSSVSCCYKGVMPLFMDVYSPISWWAWTEVFTKKSTKK
jgi:hypothetical protein